MGGWPRMSLGLGPLPHLKMPALSSLLKNARSSRPCGDGETDDPTDIIRDSYDLAIGNPLHPWRWNNDQENTSFSHHLEQARHVSSSCARSREAWRHYVGSNLTPPLLTHWATRGDSSFCNLASCQCTEEQYIVMGVRRWVTYFLRSTESIMTNAQTYLTSFLGRITRLFATKPLSLHASPYVWNLPARDGLHRLLKALSESGGVRLICCTEDRELHLPIQILYRDLYKGMICYLLEVATVRRKTLRECCCFLHRKSYQRRRHCTVFS